MKPRAEAGLSPTRLFASGCVAGLLMGIILILSGRPVFSAATAVVLMMTLAAVSNAKFAVLHEPLVFVDFAMVEQVVKHPQLFVPYFGVLPALAIVGLIALGIGAGIELEAPIRVLPGGWSLEHLVGVVGVGAIAFVCFRLLQTRLIGWGWRLRPSLDPRRDITRFGLFGMLLLTLLLSSDRTGKDAVRLQKRRRLLPPPSGRLPDIVAVQMESFFDARLMDQRIDRDLLPCFDACADEAVFRGRLAVPAWGAYTQRTEFGFLTSLPEKELGLDRFNPYLRFAKQPVWSIARALSELGYQTICLHPFPGSFFGRHRVLPNLGFDLFLDIAAFEGARRFGPYISDQLVAEKIIEILQRTDRPKFIFAITMENHGQWRKDRLPPEEIARARAMAPGFPPEFLCYLRHVANADAMIGRLAGFLRARGDGVLCMFGDHVPSFPKLFEQSNFSDPRSDYLVWRPDCSGAPTVKDATIVELSELLLSAADIRPAPSSGLESRFGLQEGEIARTPPAMRPCVDPTRSL